MLRGRATNLNHIVSVWVQVVTSKIYYLRSFLRLVRKTKVLSHDIRPFPGKESLFNASKSILIMTLQKHVIGSIYYWLVTFIRFLLNDQWFLSKRLNSLLQRKNEWNVIKPSEMHLSLSTLQLPLYSSDKNTRPITSITQPRIVSLRLPGLYFVIMDMIVKKETV